MTIELAAISAIAAVAGFGLAFATFWLTFGGRIASAEGKAAQAEKIAEEAKKDAAEAESKNKTLNDKIYQLEIWARDEFVRKTSFEGVVSRMEKGFSDLKQEISTRLDRMTDRIEHLSGHGER